MVQHSPVNRPGTLVPRDLLGHVGVDDPQVSPDGALVAWLRSNYVPDQDKQVTSLMVTTLASGVERELLTGITGLRLPRWSPDGKWLACVYQDPQVPASTAELFVVPVAGGESKQVTSCNRQIRNLAWSPDGASLAVIYREYLGPQRGDGPNQDVLRVTRLRWKRDSGGLIGDSFDQLGLVPFQPQAAAVDSIHSLVTGRVDVASAAFSPDGTRLAFVANLSEGWEIERRSSVYLIDVPKAGTIVSDAQAEPTEVFSLADIRNPELAWSPDGSQIAATGHDIDSIGHYGAQRLWLVDTEKGTARALTTDSDGTFGNAAAADTGGGGLSGPRWSPDGQSLLAVLSQKSTVRLVQVALDGAIKPLTPADRVVAAFHADPTMRSVVALTQAEQRAADLELVQLDEGAEPQRLTNHGASILAASESIRPVHFEVSSGDGPVLDAWLLLPDIGGTDKVPVVLYCGGGPGGLRSSNFMFEWQVLAAAGYAVVWTNARGCQGYGDEFCTAILGSWGQADFTDNLRALDAALELEPRLDASRQAIAGGSYGGYQVAWALGHTDRFSAAVADRSVVNKISAFGMSDIGPQRAFEFEGMMPWEDAAKYLEQSPINQISGAKTPTLVIHSALDHRCTVDQGESLYQALLLLGVETRLVRFPNESHELSRSGRPWHRVRRMQEYLDWFEVHLKPSQGATR